MRRPSLVFFRTLAVLICLSAAGFGVSTLTAEAPEVTSERLTRLGPMMPLREPTAEEFMQEADSAPYAVIDATLAGHNSQVHDTQIIVVADKLAIVYTDGAPNQQVKLWFDDGLGGGTAGDALANGSEVRVVDALPAFDADAPRAAVSLRQVNGLLAVTYAGDDGDDLKLWYDDGRSGGIAGDAVVNGGEVRTLAAGFEGGGEVLERAGRLLVLWRDSSVLRLWADDGASAGIAGDGLINGGERRTLNVPVDPLLGNGRAVTNTGGDLALAYWQFIPAPFATLRVWVDDGAGTGVAGDLLVNGAEDRSITFFERPPEWWTSAAWVEDKLAVSFQLGSTFQDLYFWYDDGGTAGEGVAGDLVFAPTEARQLLELGNVGAFSDIVELDGRVAVTNQYVLPPQLKMFYDDGNDGTVAEDKAATGGTIGVKDPPESRAIDQPLGGGGFGASAVVFNPDPGDPTVCDHIAVAHLNKCGTCGYPGGLGLHLTTVNMLAPRALFVHDTGNRELHDPIATQEDIDLTLRWFNDGTDGGEVLITGDVTGPNTGVWMPMVENVFGWPDFMTVPVSLVPGDGSKTIFMEFRNGLCAGNITVRTVTLGVVIADPTDLLLAPAPANQTAMNWEDVLDPGLDGYNVYRATNLNIPLPGFPPTSWSLLTGTAVPPGTTTYTDTSAPMGAGVVLYYYYVTALDSLGNESTSPPN